MVRLTTYNSGTWRLVCADWTKTVVRNRRVFPIQVTTNGARGIWIIWKRRPQGVIASALSGFWTWSYGHVRMTVCCYAGVSIFLHHHLSLPHPTTMKNVHKETVVAAHAERLVTRTVELRKLYAPAASGKWFRSGNAQGHQSARRSTPAPPDSAEGKRSYSLRTGSTS